MNTNKNTGRNKILGRPVGKSQDRYIEMMTIDLTRLQARDHRMEILTLGQKILRRKTEEA
jgi:hypothetical protein